ncbi:MAG: T9SS type A sorting domain-containing protein [Ignavibacteria bacterium]|nr:T9SS type A sorting domain-containing protein [Ignavibacteria bacterium]
MFRFLLLGVLSCISFCVHLPAQLLDEVPDVASNFRSARSGRWVDLSTWQVLRSGVWITATREVGVPNGFANVFIEAGHTVIATRATTEAAFYNGAQGSAFLDVINLNIHTNASITTTWGSVVGGFAPTDWYDGDRFGGFVSTEYAGIAAAFPISTRFGNQDTAIYRVHPLTEPQIEYRPRNMELRIYGNLRYYSGSAFDRSDRAAQIQVTAATIGTGSTLVFRGVSRVITKPEEWSATLATQTGYFDNTAYTASMLASNPPERRANFRGLMGRNSFWTAIFDLGRINNRNYSADQFEGPTDDPSTAVGTLQGTFTAGIVQVRRGTLRVEAPALLVNEGSVTSGVLHVMNNAVLQMVSGNVGRTGVYAEQFANGSANYLTSTECRVTSRMRYAVVEEGGALEFPGIVGSLSAADVRFNGTVIYSRTGDQTLVQDSPYLSFNPAGPIIAPGLAAGENGLFDPYNNNFNANAGVQQAGDPTSGVLSQFGSSPSGLGVGTAALFQPSTTAAYSHLVLRGSGTKFLPVTTVTISRALILQGEARLGLQNLAYPGVPVSAGNASAPPVLPYYLSQAHGGELRASQSASKAGYFPPLVYLRSTGLTGFREENNIGTTLRTSLSGDGTETTSFAATPQPLWSAYGGNTDPVAFVGFTTASTRIILYDQALYPEGASFPVGITLSASTNREQMDMTPSIKAPVVHGLPAEPSYLSIGAGHGYAARGLFYGDAPQALDRARFGQVIRQTLNRVNGTQSATTIMQKPLTGVQNFVNGFPVITNSLYDAPINSTATTTLQYDSETSEIMSEIEFPSGVWGVHNVVINSASNVAQTLPQRTADFQPASGNGVNWGLPHLNFTNRTSALTGTTAGTLIAGPEHVMTANGHLPRHAFDLRTGLYQPNAVYNETANGADSITPGTLASAYIDTRPDVNNENTKINDQYYTTGVGLRPSVSLTGTFDGRTRAGFPQGVANAPSVFGTTQTITTTAPNDFGRRGDFNNFGVLELRRGNLNGVNGRLNIEMQTLTLSSTAIISPDQAKVTYRGERVGTNNARARVCLSDATGSESYPRQTIWNSVGVRYGGDGVGGIVVRGPAGYVWGTLTLGTRASLIITGGTGGTIAVASQSPLLRFRAQGIINTGFDELPATLGIPGLEALPALPDATQITVNPAPDPNGFNNAWNLDLPYIRSGVGNLTMLRGTSNILTLLGNSQNSQEGLITTFEPERSGLQVFGTIATARGSLDLNGRNIELSGTTSTLVEAFERSPRPSSVVNRHTKARAYIGLTSPRAVPLLDSAAAAQSLASGGVPLAASLAGLGSTIVNANFNADSTRFRVRRWQTSAANALTRLNAPNVPLANRYWTIETSGTQRITRNFGLVLNYTDADVAQSLAPAPLALLRGQLLPTQTPFQALAPSDRTDTTRKRTKQLALFAPEQVVYGQSIIGTGNFALQQDSSQAGFQLWALGTPAPVSLVLRGQRFGGKFGDPIGTGFEGATTDILGFPPPFGAAWQGGGISRQAANDFGAIIGPFKAGIPTCATIIGEVLDELGNVAQFAPSTGAALVVGQVGGGLGPWNTGVPALFSRTTGYPSGKIGAVSRGGRFEWANVRLDGVASTTVTLTLTNDLVDKDDGVPRPNPASQLVYADPQPVQVSLQGGFPFFATFATQHINNSPDVPGMIYPGAQGPFAVPGTVASDPWNGITGYAGSTPYIEVGKTVVLPYSSPGYSSITGIVIDRFGNYASFPTTATISIAGGSPPVDQQRTPLVGQVSEQKLVWGLGNLGNESGLSRVIGSVLPSIQSASRVSPALAPTGAGYAPYNNPQLRTNLVSFPNFQIWGATSSNVTMVMSVYSPWWWVAATNKNASEITSSSGNTSSTITIAPGPAVGIAPVIVPDVYNRNQPDRMPSKMFIGASNRGNPSTWFYVQAVDQFGNRVDNGPNAYNGGTANIRFFSPEEGLPKNTSGTFQFTTTTPRDPYVRANNQRYSARGTSAPAINGLYTFNDFTPLGPASLEALGKDVVLTFEDERLKGVTAPFASGATGLFRPIPPITTATTTFVQPPTLTLSASDSVLNGARKAAPNGLFLRERARTYRSTQNALETGFVRLTRPVTALADPTLNVQYSLDYFNATSGFDTTTFRISDRARLTSLPLAGTTTLPLPSAIILPDGLPSPALFPPMPQPVPTTINGLLGDVAPLAVGASGLSTAALGTSGTIAFESGAVAQNVCFSARFSDQTYPRNPARQGVRLAVMWLLADTTLPYRVERGADSAFVVLADPASADPLCINPLTDKLYLMTGTNNNPIQETLELEPPAWTSLAGKPAPAWVFYDDNYDALQYAAWSSDTTLVRVSVNAVDMRFSGRPTLNYTIPAFAPVETSASIILTASDGFSQARDTFAIALRRPVGVELAQMPEPQFLRLSPNPTTDEVAIDFRTPRAGVVRFCLRNVLGMVVWQQERSVYAGERLSERVSMQHCAAGVYLLEAQLGAERSVVKVVKE